MSAIARTPKAPAAESVKPRSGKPATPKRPTRTLTVVIRRQGGARIMTIPPIVLASLGADEGTRLAIAVKGGKL